MILTARRYIADSVAGTFVRLLAPGIWPLTFTASGYRDTTINCIVNEGQKTDITGLDGERRQLLLIQSFLKPPALYPNPSSLSYKRNSSG